MTELYTVACAVCRRRLTIPAHSQEDAWGVVEREKGWEVYHIPGSKLIEIRCPKHWVRHKGKEV